MDDTDMIEIAGGPFLMGSDEFYPEEAPRRWVTVEPLLIDRTPVTNAAFLRFVDRTGHRTAAERESGSLVFAMTDAPVRLDDARQWWHFRPGASWRHPRGPDSTIDGLLDHPVVHVTYDDARAYAAWSGKSLPTEAEWEIAARGGLEGARYAWGEDFEPSGTALANYWSGRFPFRSDKPPGGETTSPVGAYPSNGFGLADMIGNVWEWTEDAFDRSGEGNGSPRCCAGSGVDQEPAACPPVRRVLKGGSHLCAPEYCQRYRPAARIAGDPGASTSHIGFRCVKRLSKHEQPSPTRAS